MTRKIEGQRVGDIRKRHELAFPYAAAQGRAVEEDQGRLGRLKGPSPCKKTYTLNLLFCQGTIWPLSLF
jgi:hypothetical protein